MDKRKTTLTEVRTAQNLWAQGLIHIGDAAHLRLRDKEIEKRANEMLDELYNFKEEDHILFKPTLAIDHPIRFNRVQTFSYFIGGKIGEDNGFALKPWREVIFHPIEEKNIFTEGEMILVMGIYTFVDYQGEETTVEYTLGYKRGTKKSKYGHKHEPPLKETKLRIVLHHSSLTFAKEKE